MFGLEYKCKDQIQFRQLSTQTFSSLEWLKSSFPIHAVNLILPRTMRLPSQIEEAFDSLKNSYILIKDLPVTSLVEDDFVEAFLKKGSLWVLTINADSSYDNFVAILPEGKFMVSLRKCYYDVLALTEDIRNQKESKKKCRLTKTFSIDLKLGSTDKKYKKFVSELKKLEELKFDVILKWVPSDSQMSATPSLHSYFVNNGFNSQICHPEYLNTVKYLVPLPKVNYSMPYEEMESCSNERLFNWIGEQTCSIIYKENEDKFISSLNMPEPSIVSDQLFVCVWKGLFSNLCIQEIIKQSSDVLKMNSSMPYLVLTVHGYEDSWVHTAKNDKILSGDKIICIVIFPDNNYWVYRCNKNMDL